MTSYHGCSLGPFNSGNYEAAIPAPVAGSYAMGIARSANQEVSNAYSIGDHSCSAGPFVPGSYMQAHAAPVGGAAAASAAHVAYPNASSGTWSTPGCGAPNASNPKTMFKPGTSGMSEASNYAYTSNSMAPFLQQGPGAAASYSSLY